MNLGAPELLIVLFMCSFLFVPVWGIIDAALKPTSIWVAANQSKVVWILLQIVLGALGTVIYVAAVRPKLTAAAAAIDATLPPPSPSTSLP